MSQLSRGNLAPTDLGGKYLSLLRVYTGELRLVKPYICIFDHTLYFLWTKIIMKNLKQALLTLQCTSLVLVTEITWSVIFGKQCHIAIDVENNI